MSFLYRVKIIVSGFFLAVILAPDCLFGGQVPLQWDPSTDPRVAGYRVHYGTASGHYTSTVDACPNPTAIVTGLTPGTTYYFVVAAHDVKGIESGFSNEVTNCAPIPPTLAASDSSSNAASMNFTQTNLTETNAWETDPGAVTASASLSTNPLAAVAGVYNGLFYETNADGSPNVTVDSAGFLGNCVVASNGIYSAKVCFGGVPYPLAGVFDGFGNAWGMIPLDDIGLSNLTVFLHLDLSNGTRQITGVIAGTTASNAWTAPLLGDLATNAFPQLAGAVFLVPPGSAGGSPPGFGMAVGFATNSVLTMNGELADGEGISQTVPISKDGNVPVYIEPVRKQRSVGRMG